MTYVERRGRSGIYETRVQLPKVLAGKPVPAAVRGEPRFSVLINAKTGRFKHEVSRSLKTTDHAAAKRLGLRQAADLRALIDEAAALVSPASGSQAAGSDATRGTPGRSGLPVEIILREILEAVPAVILSEDEAERDKGDDRRQLMTAEERARLYPDLVPLELHRPDDRGMEEDHRLLLSELVEETLADHRKALSARRTEIIRVEAHHEIRKRGVDPASIPETQRRAFELDYLRATLKGIEGRRERNEGKDVPTPPLSGDRGPRLSEALAAWSGGGGARGAKVPGRQTVAEAERAVSRFCELHGDLPLGAITKQHGRAFRDALAKVPPHLPKALRRLTLPEILRRTAGEPGTPSAATVNKSLTLIGAVVSFAEREGHLEGVSGYAGNPMEGILFVIDKRGEERRLPFSASAIAALFSSPVFVKGLRPAGGGGEAAFWFPLIGLLSGLRLEEIGGLRIADLREDDAADQASRGAGWFFDVAPESGRSLKTVSSRRRVPVHPELERAGLLRYREAILAASGGDASAPLWPQLAVSTTKGGHFTGNWSQWFGRYLRHHAGIEDRRLVFHSLRHSFADLCRDAALEEEVRHALTGHTGGGVGRSYGSGFPLRLLAAAVAKLESPAAVKALSWNPPSGWTPPSDPAERTRGTQTRPALKRRPGMMKPQPKPRRS